MSSTEDSVVRLVNVSKSYWLDKVRVDALRDVGLEIRRSRFTVLRGPSGSGKTTLLSLIGALDRPDQGEVIVEKRNVAQMSDQALSEFRRTRIGFIFQNFNLLPVLSVYENVEYPLLIMRTGRAERQRRVAEVLADVGIADQAGKRPNQLSGGQRQRVAVARALVKQPAIVLADEPTANLDSETGRNIVSLMRQMQAKHSVSFVLSSHDPDIIAEADDVLNVHDGQVAPASVDSIAPAHTRYHTVA